MFRPLSFTRNLGGTGQERLHEALRRAYTPGISSADFRASLQPDLSAAQTLIVAEFFLCTYVENGQEIILEDTLVRYARDYAYDLPFARLAFFAMISNLCGRRLRPEQEDACAFQNAFVRNELWRSGAWLVERMDRDHVRGWIGAHVQVENEKSRNKVASNFRFLFFSVSFSARRWELRFTMVRVGASCCQALV